MIGTSAIRKEGRAKVLGTARYTDDKHFAGEYHGITLRAPVSLGILKGIHFDEGLPWDEFVRVTAADIPGKNIVASVQADQPFLVADRIRHAGEPILLLAHPDPDLLQKARQAIRFEIDPDPDPEAQRCFKDIRINKGDVDTGLGEAAHIIEGEYCTGAQEHAYLEPNAMVAMVRSVDGQKNLTLCGSMQCPYYVHRAMMQLFGLEAEQVRVVQMETGGAFGGKEDYPSVIAGHAALLAWKSGHTVRMIYDREEDMRYTTKRHPSKTRIRSGFDAKGHLVALDIDFELEGGAYATMSPVVLSRGAIHAGGAYRCPNTRIQARALSTPKPPFGAFRGFGAPQSLFAIERHMDRCAHRMGIDPIELRRRNVLQEGDTTSTGQHMLEILDLQHLMDESLSQLPPASEKLPSHIKRGVGLSLFMHGSGFTGSGEDRLASVAGVEGLRDGRVGILAASTELGQGKDTVFSQIVAGALQLPLDLVEVAQSDTSVVPDSGPTVASRSTLIVGKLLEDAAYAFKQLLIQDGLLEEPYTPEAFQKAVRIGHERHGSQQCYAQYHHPPHIHWDDVNYQGDAYPTFSWACQVARVEVDTLTWEVKVEAFVSTQEVGRVVNPTLASGQIEGGVAQGIGWALMEDVQFKHDVMANATLSTYMIPTIMDLPPIQVRFLENPYPGGPGGAKGLGELPMDGPAPAILNAIAHALDTQDLFEVPMTPEKLLEIMAPDDAASCR